MSGLWARRHMQKICMEDACGLCAWLTHVSCQLSCRAHEIFSKFLCSKATTPVNIDSQAQLADDTLSTPHPDMFKEQQLQVPPRFCFPQGLWPGCGVETQVPDSEPPSTTRWEGEEPVFSLAPVSKCGAPRGSVGDKWQPVASPHARFCESAGLWSLSALGRRCDEGRAWDLVLPRARAPVAFPEMASVAESCEACKNWRKAFLT